MTRERVVMTQDLDFLGCRFHRKFFSTGFSEIGFHIGFWVVWAGQLFKAIQFVYWPI